MKKFYFLLLLLGWCSCVYADDVVVVGPSISVSQCPMGVASHKIVYNTNGGSEEEPDYVSSMVPSDTSLPTPTKSGYEFGGWYYDAELTKKVEVNSYREIPFTPKYNENGCTVLVTTTIYAKWIKEVGPTFDASDIQCPVGGSPYLIIYNTNGGNKLDSYSHCGGCLPVDTKLPTPKRKGYEFDGWYYDSKFKKKVNTNYANKITYTQAYNANGCITQAKVNLYAKWKKIKTDENSGSASTTEKEDCSKEVNNLKIIFNTNGGSSIEPLLHCSQCNGEPVSVPLPVKEGYTFDGWYYESELINKVTVLDITKINYKQNYDKNGCMELTEVNLYAKWVQNVAEDEEKDDDSSEKKIVVVYNTVGGNSLLNDKSCFECQNKTRLETPKKEGFKFAGWYYDKELTKKVSAKYVEDLAEGKVLSENETIELYAKWEIAEKETENKISIVTILIIIIAVLIVLLMIVSAIKNSKKKKDSVNNIETLGL